MYDYQIILVLMFPEIHRVDSLVLMFPDTKVLKTRS